MIFENSKDRIYIALSLSIAIHAFFFLLFTPYSANWRVPDHLTFFFLSADLEQKEPPSLLSMKEFSSPPSLFFPIERQKPIRRIREDRASSPLRATLYIEGEPTIELLRPHHCRQESPARVSIEVKWQRGAKSPFSWEVIKKKGSLISSEEKKNIQRWLNKIPSPQIYPEKRPIVEGLIEIEYGYD